MACRLQSRQPLQNVRKRTSTPARNKQTPWHRTEALEEAQSARFFFIHIQEFIIKATSSALALSPKQGLDLHWSDDAGKLLLRLAVGVLVLLHGVFKIGAGPGFVLKMLAAHNLPGALGYLVYIGEILAPVLIIVGLWTRPAALVVAINMIVAIALVHTGQFLEMTKQGGWALELQGLYLFGALAIMLLGAGRYALAGNQRGLN